MMGGQEGSFPVPQEGAWSCYNGGPEVVLPSTPGWGLGVVMMGGQERSFSKNIVKGPDWSLPSKAELGEGLGWDSVRPSVDIDEGPGGVLQQEMERGARLVLAWCGRQNC